MKIEVHVSPSGDDRAPGTLEAPVKTLAAAQKRARLLHEQEGYSREGTVYLHEGEYRLSTPLTFGGEDNFPCCWRPYGEEKAVITSAQPVDGLKETSWKGMRAWQAYLPSVDKGGKVYHTLFAHGEERGRTRLPREGFYTIARTPNVDFEKAKTDPAYAVVFNKGTDTFEVEEGEMRQWENMEDVEAMFPHYWVEERSPLESYDEATRTVTLKYTTSYALVDDAVPRYSRYALENVKEALDTPGQWYIDRPTGILTYLPKEGETLENTVLSLPSLVEGIRLEGASMIRFSGLTFQGFDYDIPPVKREDLFLQMGKLIPGQGGQGAATVPAAVALERSSHCIFENCLFTHLGGYALEVGRGCSYIQVSGCEFSHLSGGGVRLNGADAGGPEEDRTHHNQILDCHMYDLGRVFHAACGILSMHAAYNNYSHNHIHDLYYTAISVGWVWGYAPSVSHHNLICHNHLHDIGKGLLSDMGGIYTLGEQPGTILRGNVIHDIDRRNYGGWAIYPDEGSSYIVIEDNLCYDTASHSFHEHYGRENIVRNNIFAFGGEGSVGFTRPEGHISYAMYSNVFLSNGAAFHVSPDNKIEEKGFLLDSNLYWNYRDGSFASGNGNSSGMIEKRMTKVLDFAQWQAMGLDLHSVVADPGFADPLHHDFSLQDTSILDAIGFHLPDWSSVGPRPEKQGKRG